MNFTKAFTNKKEISEFKKNYSNLTIKSEVISNLYNSHIKPEKFTELFKFLDNQDDFFYLNILASTVADMALTESFGKYDFKFYANRCYKIWLLKFNDDIFMVPAQREVIIKDKLDKNTIDNSIEFEKAFLNFCINYALKNKDKLQDIDLKFLEKYENLGIIKNNCIDFIYQKNAFKP